eukprot:Em0299g3a
MQAQVTEGTTDSREVEAEILMAMKLTRCVLRSALSLQRVFTSKQCLPLRGHRDDGVPLDLEDRSNPGNFIELLKFWVRSGDDALACHFTESHKNAIYQSKTTQNELITIIGEQILHTIVNRSSSNGGFFSVIADEDMKIPSQCKKNLLALSMLQPHNRSSFSSKGEKALMDIIDGDEAGPRCRYKLKEHCHTRWVERHDAYEVFIDLYSQIVDTLTTISGSTGFNAETTKDATALLAAVTKFEFIITLYIVGYIMGYMKQLSVVLQGSQQHIACGYKPHACG